MERLKSLLVSLGSLAVECCSCRLPLQQPSKRRSTRWTTNWRTNRRPGRCQGSGANMAIGADGEEDKRGMLNYITPEMIVKAAGLVKQGKVYALGEELHNDVPRIITPTRIGIQIIQERDGYDRTAGRLGSSTRSAVRVRPVSPSCIPIRARIWTPFPMSTGKTVCTIMRRPATGWHGAWRCGECQVYGRAWGLARCRQVQGRRSCPVGIGSLWKIFRIPPKRRRWRYRRAIFYWFGRVGGRCGTRQARTGGLIPHTPSGMKRNQEWGLIVWLSSTRWRLWPSVRITRR